MKPMLAERKLPDTSSLRYPLYASPKLDGVRAVVRSSRVLGRSLKSIPNSFTQRRFGVRAMNGLDGELIVGSPTAKDAFLQTSGALRRHEGEPDAKFYCFDLWDEPRLPYWKRLNYLQLMCNGLSHVVPLYGQLMQGEAELLAYEKECLAAGYEGLILRSPDGPYKYGRSTMREGYMLKLKRFEDAEGVVVGVYEEMHNANEAKTNELGRTERSSAQENLVPKGALGGLVLRDDENFPGVTFECGTGFTAAQRAELWGRRGRLTGQVWKYKFFAHGGKDRPRHPVIIGPRDGWDR